MADKFAKRGLATRFGEKKTFGARTVKRTVITRRTHPALAGRPARRTIPLKGGR